MGLLKEMVNGLVEFVEKNSEEFQRNRYSNFWDILSEDSDAQEYMADWSEEELESALSLDGKMLFSVDELRALLERMSLGEGVSVFDINRCIYMFQYLEMWQNCEECGYLGDDIMFDFEEHLRRAYKLLECSEIKKEVRKEYAIACVKLALNILDNFLKRI